MNVQQLRYVVEVADAGTMTAAADRLNVSQPALSRGVRELEHELHVVLFERVGRNVVLAPNAAGVIDAARRALAAIDDVRRAASATPLPPLVIAATSTLAAVFADRVLPALADHPIGRHIRFIHADGPDQTEQLVLNGDAEIGAIDRHPSPGWSSTRLGEEQVVLVVSAAAQLPDRVPLAALDGLPMIMPSAGSPRRRETDEFLAAMGITPLVALESDERSTWASAVLSGVGSVLWFETNAQEAVQRGARTCSFDPPLVRTLHLIHRPDQLSSACTALLDVVEKHVGHETPTPE